jgi:hypothetical protein
MSLVGRLVAQIIVVLVSSTATPLIQCQLIDAHYTAAPSIVARKDESQRTRRAGTVHEKASD